jgi:hypothetical protein
MKVIHCVSGEEVFVDDEDFEYLSQYKWYFHKSDGYTYRNLEKKRNSKRIAMHKELIECPLGYERDHINRNRLDNRRENLRVVTHKVNSRNRKRPTNNTSGYMGVWPCGKKFVAEIRYENQKYYLGIFENSLDAAKAYDRKAIEFGFKHLNFPEGDLTSVLNLL